MEIQTDTLRNMAPILERLGEALDRALTGEPFVELSCQLKETAAQFAQLPSGTLSTESFDADQGKIFRQNLEELAKVACAAGNEQRRQGELMAGVGLASDRAGMGDECRKVATELLTILFS